jgi:hypothetical protein
MSLVSSHGLWRSRSEGRDFLQSSRPIGIYWNDSLATLMVRLLRVALCPPTRLEGLCKVWFFLLRFAYARVKISSHSTVCIGMISVSLERVEFPSGWQGSAVGRSHPKGYDLV